MERTFSPSSLALSSFIHLLVLSLFLLSLPQPKPAEKVVTIDLVTWDGPLGDNGTHDRPSPKKQIVQVPQQVGRNETRSRLHVQRPKTAPKLASPSKVTVSDLAEKSEKVEKVDLEAALRERFEKTHERDTERASSLGASAPGFDAPQSPSDNGKGPGGAPGGVSGDGQGVSGQLATRGILRRVLPDYPGWAEKRWLEGDVRLRLWVNAGGEVTKVQILGMSGTRDFDRNALAALKQWRFSPIDGDEIQTGEITIQYRLGQ